MSRPMVRPTAVLVCWSMVAAFAWAQPVQRNFEGERIGRAPAGFEFVATRQSRPGTWTVRREAAGHVVAHDADVPSQQGSSLAVAVDAPPRNFSASVRMKTAGGERSGGLVWGYQDPENHYFVHLDLARQEMAMYRVVNGNRIRLEREDDLELDVDAWHALKVVREGPEARVYLGGIRVFEVRDRTFRTGRVGLSSTSGSTTLFDDFRVQPDEP